MTKHKWPSVLVHVGASQLLSNREICAAFPLTLSLSPRRGNNTLTAAIHETPRPIPARSSTLPLPKGEGWGEGKQGDLSSVVQKLIGAPSVLARA
ncbi:MAG: hypothetical protein HYY23_07435 [Verrucomicrobia bacterium]|nr:hypothetical protein [Verrucomicrobiota bacterium]